MSEYCNHCGNDVDVKPIYGGCVCPKYYPNNFSSNEIERAASDICAEIVRAKSLWPEFNSAHEGFAVLMEEVDELKEHVWTNQKRRDLEAMKKEAIQVAAMALRFATEVCCEKRGRK